jgi:hypothetical protein
VEARRQIPLEERWRSDHDQVSHAPHPSRRRMA